MTSFRVTEAVQRAGRLVRPARFRLGMAVLLAAAVPSTAAFADSLPTGQAAVAWDGRGVADFYSARQGQPLWFAPGNEQAASDLLQLLGSAQADGLDPRRYRVGDLQRALRAAWGGNPSAVRRADFLLSQAFAAYVRDLRSAPAAGTIFVDAELRPRAPGARVILEEAARSPLPRFVRSMGWMHPHYRPLRDALLGASDAGERARIAVNLERVRLLPAATSGRYVLVNAAAGRLDMVEPGGKLAGTMRVVVGKPAQQTPMMAALIRFTSLNPYWNVPPDLVAERVAPYVLKEGFSFLRAKGYQVLSDWTDEARPVDPATIDWKAVAEGRTEIRVRQLPGPHNSMGAMKFMFPNEQGIYLHDTPSTELFSEAARFFSGGCVRLEAAPRLAAWLYGRPLRASGARPEQQVNLPESVPVYLTYLTAVPGETGEIAFLEDSYGRDAERLAQLGGTLRSPPLPLASR